MSTDSEHGLSRDRSLPSAKPQRLWHLVFLASLLVLTLLVYARGLSGPFLFDDFPNVIEQPHIAVDTLEWQALKNAGLTNQSGPVGRPLPAVTFALNFYFAGQRFDRVAFKGVNLAIHLANGLLVWVLARLLVGQFRARTGDFRSESFVAYLPLVIAGMWLLHPLQLTSVLYVVQRMNSLSALFVLAGLVVFCYGRRRLAEERSLGLSLMVTGLAGGTVFGMLCKENAVLLPFYAVVIEVFACDRGALSARNKRRLGWFYAATVGLPALAAAMLLLHNPGVVSGGYATRSFELDERLLTQARVLFFYLGLILLPRLNAFGLFHDDVVVSRSLLEPWTTGLSVLGILLLLVVVAWSLARRRYVLGFAVGWFLVGHALESSVFPLELVHEHRNYLPIFGVLFAGLYFGAQVMDRAKRLPAGLIVFPVVLFGAVTFVRADTWGDQERWVNAQLRHHPQSARVQESYAEHARQRGRFETAYEHFSRAAELNRAAISPLIAMARLTQQVTLNDDSLRRDLVPDNADRDPTGVARDRREALRERISEEIERRIDAAPPAAANLSALKGLSECIARTQEDCLPLVRLAERWLQAMLTKPPPRPGQRAVILFDLARLAARQGELEVAWHHLSEAQRLHPTDAQLVAHEALLHIAAGDWRRAEHAIARFAAQPERNGFSESDVDFLRRSLRAARGRNVPSPS
jgi:tetratricopeptide (TPR) repeat protein/uncharacterized membrane protein HdeD (DUF308 family)